MTARPEVYDQAGFEVRFDWGLAGAGVLASVSDVLVVVDVLSFSTAVEVALARDATVIPTDWSDERADALAAERGAILARGRSQTTAATPYSLSPASLADLPAGTCLVLPSPNGAAIIRAAAELGPGGPDRRPAKRRCGSHDRQRAGRHDQRHCRWRALARRQPTAGVGGSTRRGCHPRPPGWPQAFPRSPGRRRRCPLPRSGYPTPPVRIRARTDRRRL